jgi:hypothetical protein
MNRRVLYGLALAASLPMAACSDRPHEPSLGDSSTMASAIPAACSPNAFNSLIAGYFVPPQQQLVQGYRDAMIAQLSETPTDVDSARIYGYNILREIALRSKAVSPPSASTGSALAVEVLECIYEPLNTAVIEQVPSDNTFFIEELDRAHGGTFEVRGGDGDPPGPVQAAVDNVVIAGVAPPSGVTWNDALNNQRILFYGDTASSSSDYHFSWVPISAAFDPPLVVTTCVESEDPSLMVTEENVGVLAFVDATHIGCGAPPLSAGPTGRFELLRHFAALGRKLILPQPAVATMVLTSVVGGSAKGRSLFDVDPVTDLDVTPDPTRVSTLVVNSGTFDLEVTVMEDGRLVNGATVVLSTGTNSGAFNFIHEQSNGTCSEGTPTAVTGSGEFPTGTVTFNDLCITQTGYVTVFINVGFDERSGTGSATIPRIKVIPPKK